MAEGTRVSMGRLGMRLVLAMAAMLAIPAGARAADPAWLAQHVRTLSSSAFEGRFPGTAGEAKSVAYIVSQFRGAGLSPGGEVVDGRRTWFQRVPITESKITGPVRATLTTAGGSKAWAQGKEIALRSTLQDVSRVEVKDAPFVFIGGSYADPDKDGRDLEGFDLKGKIALFLFTPPAPSWKPKPGAPRPPGKAEQAARAGAAGVLFIHQAAVTGYAWETLANTFLQTRLEIPRTGPAPTPVPLSGAIREDAAADLFRAAGLDLAQMSEASRAQAFKPVPLTGPTLSVDYPVSVTHGVSRTVIGRLAGRTRPQETVILGAHWDHLGLGAPDATGDRVYHGALDNASGVAGVIEVAREVAHRPRTARSLVFIAWALEEPGLLGSTWYVEHPVYPLATTVADITLDCLLPIGRARDFGGWGYEESTLADWMQAAGAAQGRRYQPSSHPERGYKLRSDHYPFAKAGVPALYFLSGSDLVDGGRDKGEVFFTDFFAHRYHQQSDRFDASWKLDGIAQDVDLLADVVQRLGNARDWPEWKPGSEFRGAREASASERGAGR